MKDFECYQQKMFEVAYFDQSWRLLWTKGIHFDSDLFYNSDCFVL